MAVAVGVNVAVGVGVNVAVGVGVANPEMFTHCENSDVSKGVPAENRLAVAVATVSPGGRGKLTGPQFTVQSAPVVTIVEPRKCVPSPKPDGSHDGLENNSRSNSVLATLSNVPESVTLPLLKEADVITG